MKKIITILVLTLLGLLKGMGQSSSLLPNKTPPSPQAFEMTKYGDIPVNEYSGMLNESIPLYTYKVGSLELPITMSYNASGVKVDQSCTWTGINWVLRAGGLITRTINDVADEDLGPNYRVNFQPEPFEAGLDGSQTATYIAGLVTTGNYDTEVDIFNFNFDNYSGSFYLNAIMQPVIIKNDSNLKIEVVGNDLKTNNAFIITTPNGVKYFFGGANAIERTVSISTFMNSPTSPGTTGFYLTKIKHPISGEIYFDYDHITSFTSIVARNDNYGTLTGKMGPDCSGPYQNGPDLVNLPEYLPPPPANNFSIYRHAVEPALILKSITNSMNNENISFISENFNIGNSIRVLNKIEVRNENNLLRTFDFSYLGKDNLVIGQDSNKYKRFFLNKIEIDKDLIVSNDGNKEQVYSFEYENINLLPNRLSYAQDIAGFSNGKTQNISSIPFIPNFQYNGIVVNYGHNDTYYQSIAADRKPNFSFAKNGTLTKIIYPTKGYTLFEYETNPIKDEIINNHTGEVDYNINDDDNSDEVTRINNSYYYGPIYKDQVIKINMSYVRTIDPDTPAFHNAALHLSLMITNLDDNSVTTLSNFAGASVSGGSTHTYSLQAGKNYKFELRIDGVSTLTQIETFIGNFDFNLMEGYQYGDGPGIRIKKITDYADNATVGQIKRYYYKQLNKINAPIEDQGLMLYTQITPLITYGMKNEIPSSCFIRHVYAAVQSYFQYISNNGYENSYSSTIDYNNHKIITISYGGDNFEKGGTQKIYSFFVDEPNIILYSQTPSEFDISIASNDFRSKRSNQSILNGTLLQELNFIKKNNLFYKLTQTDYEYNFGEVYDSSIFFTNLCGTTVYIPSGYGPGIDPGTTTSNMFITKYKTRSYNLDLVSKTSTNYFEDITVPTLISDVEIADDNDFTDINPIDESNIKKVVESQNYVYGIIRGLPTEITTSTSENGIVDRTVNKYANDISVTHTLPYLTNDQIFANQQLVAMNNIASPVQVEKYKGQNLLSTQRTIYRQVDPNNSNSILPSIIQTSKGAADLEDRAEFVEYDSKGNLSIARLSNGSQIKYYYNDYNQVIVKIENYSGGLNLFQNPLQNISPCDYQQQNPNSMISIYNYDTVTHQILSIVGPNCKTTFYEYNSLHQLVRIRDNENNILQEFDHNYKPQN